MTEHRKKGNNVILFLLLSALTMNMSFSSHSHAGTKEEEEMIEKALKEIDEEQKTGKTPQSEPKKAQNAKKKTDSKITFENSDQEAGPTQKKSSKSKQKAKQEKSTKPNIDIISDEEIKAQIHKEEKRKKLIESGNVYVPSPTDSLRRPGLLVERDSGKIVTISMSIKDSINVKVCFNAGLSIVLGDEGRPEEFQTVLLDDDNFFSALPMENKRGVYIKLKKPIPSDGHWESAIRLVKKADDKSYLINLIGVACPTDGIIPFPKVIYIKDKIPAITESNKIYTPEDSILSVLGRYFLEEDVKRVFFNSKTQSQLHGITVYDMVASSGSNWFVFGVEVAWNQELALPKDSLTAPEFVFLDTYQISEITSKTDFLKFSSEIASSSKNSTISRYNIKVNIDKNYIISNRYLYMMFVDKANKLYQYKMIDLLPYMSSLKERGFEL